MGRGIIQRQHGCARTGSSGFTLVEVVVALAILVVGVLGALSAVSSSAVVGESTPELTRAQLGAQAMLERLRTENFSALFAQHNEKSGQSGFAVVGLAPQDGDADGMVGEILFPTPPGEPDVLREDSVLPDFGLPLDLDGDGVLENDDVSGTYVQLPVRVRVAWSGRSGDHEVSYETVLGGW